MQPLYRFLFLLALATLTLTQTTHAQVVRVTNGQSLSALIASATVGTTFIVEPGSYGDLTISKRVAIIGPGYFLGSNQQANLNLDARFQLPATSPAKGAGEGGIDCGAFGGDEPYVIGGVPSGPVITELTVPQVTSGSTLNVRVRAKVQN